MKFLMENDFFIKMQVWFAQKLPLIKERWVSIASFIIALAFHILLVSLGTKQYLGAPLHPERSNQTVQKLEEAIKKKNMRFVYIKDDPSIVSKAKPHPEAPLSDKDRVGSSPDGGKGDSWDPYSEGNSPQRGFPSVMLPPSQIGRNIAPRKGIEGREESKIRPSDKIKEEAAKIAGIKEDAGKSIKGFSLNVENKNEAKEGEGKESEEAIASNKGTESKLESGIAGQIGQMMAESLKGGYRNTNASRLNRGAVSFETSGWDLGPYARIVQQKVESNWRIPAVQEILRQKGWVAVHFEILKDGSVQNVQIERSSRIPSYDQAAVNALKSSNPFPPLPSFVTEEKISGTFRFFYNMWSENDE